jgi:pyruvate dehydrogenase E1 component alpha subunit
MDLTAEKQLDMLRTMQTIRRFEERASDDFHAGAIHGVVHSYIGQEAVAVGVCAALNRDEQIISTHRGHGHCIAKGADLKRMMAELYGKKTGYCKGKGGSMHLADFSIGMLGANGIVAGGIPIITGAGLAAQLDGTGRVAVSFFGDGAASAGPFHESLDIAALWKLPTLYICENNYYGVNTPASDAVAIENVADRAAAYNVPGVIVDGNDVLAVYEVTEAAAESLQREGVSVEVIALATEDRETFARLKAPVKRICTLQVPAPYSPELENHVFPNRDKIAAGVKSLLD